MRDLKDLLTRVKQEHLDRLGSIRRELKMLPPGRLEALQQHGRIYYYQNAQERRRGITRKPELVRQLARKRYLLEERKILQHNLKEIERALGKCESCGMNGILQKLPERISQLPRQYFYKKRRLRKYDKNPAYPENLVYATNGGEMVRSKSEQSIGNMLEEYDIDPNGKNCVVIGRSNIVGKPMAMLLLHKNGTVTICHSRTKNLKEVCAQADILVAAVGKADFVTADMVKEGAVVIDVGMNRKDGKLCGDVAFDEVNEKASYLTPVPGGVGPMTITMLMKNTLKAAKLHHGIVD